MAAENTSFTGFDFEKPIVELEKQIQELETGGASNGQVSGDLESLVSKCEKLKKEVYGNLTAWQRVQIARHPRRPYTLDYVERLFTDFVELHGDRHYAEDKAVVGGMAYFDGEPVMLIGHQKGRTVQESMARNFGMPHPEGYRKALRLMQLAARYEMPIVTFIDTAGAYPGIGAEERGQATAIAENLREMAAIPVPIICAVIGEGGSGGALAIGVGDRLLMLENAWYSVISPEGCASILYRDPAKAADAAEALKITAGDLQKLGIIDEVVPEPLGGAHRDHDATAEGMKQILKKHLAELKKLTADQLLDGRYMKYRSVGKFLEEQQKKAASSPRAKKSVES